MRGLSCAALLVVAGVTVAVVASAGQTRAPAPFVGVLDEHPVIQYAQRPPRDRVSSLSQALERGTRSLAFHEQGGYLPAVLKELSVPADSQLLVFSKTGIQRAATGPRSPRALYFDDSVVIGYVPGARFLELAAHDPEQGVVFYTIDQTVRTKPAVTRRTECLTCHVSGSTLEVPGMIARSNFVDADGGLLPQLGSHIVNHRTPLPNRWEGWFVTGNYPTLPYSGVGHLGNVTIAVHPTSGPVTTSNEIFIEWLNSAPEPRGYPLTDSDIAALMLFDHQMHAINLHEPVDLVGLRLLHDRRALVEQPLKIHLRGERRSISYDEVGGREVGEVACKARLGVEWRKAAERFSYQVARTPARRRRGRAGSTSSARRTRIQAVEGRIGAASGREPAFQKWRRIRNPQWPAAVPARAVPTPHR